jgi:demethylmenaquinone methyltransferase / 2-methoxy-6-polyprenyl-1,4-benzoquinol methylase
MSDPARPPQGEEAVVHAPHPPLTQYYDGEHRRRDWVRAIFDSSAPDYDRVERLMALGSGSWYRRRTLVRAGLATGMRVVDVGVGTGMVAREAARIVGAASLVTGVDPSPGMLANARVPEGVTLIEGPAEAIPLPDGCADFVSMGYALRHIGDLSAAFREFHRVLKPGGIACVLEITRPETRLRMLVLKTYMRGVIPALSWFVARNADTPKLMRYYWDTIETCVPPARVVATLEAAGLEDVKRLVEAGIFSEYRAIRPRAS